ncbi:MAG: crossover junction endodeoxyribonuclease RuvC [Vicinamibacterales bacterium]
MRIFGIDPGSTRTGYGCVETDGTRHRLLACGALAAPAAASFPEKLGVIHAGLCRLLRETTPDAVAIENVFHARNVRSALLLGHARGVAMLAAVAAELPITEYSPAEIKLAVAGYGKAEKRQVQHMVTLLLGLETAPSPHDAADALAVAICHAHAAGSRVAAVAVPRAGRAKRSWRRLSEAELPRRQAP